MADSPPAPATTVAPGKASRQARRVLGGRLLRRVLAAAGFGISITLVGVAGLANLGHAGTLAVSVLAIGTAAGSGFVLRRRLLKTERFVIDALKAYERGERRTEALRVSSRGAPATEAWNEIIGNRGELEIERVRIESLRAAVEAGGPPSRSGDALEAMWHGVILLNDRGEVIEANGAASVLLGLARSEVAGNPIVDLLGSEELNASVDAVIKGTTARSVATIKRDLGGRVSVLRASIRRVRRDDTASAMLVLEDVTQQHIAEQARTAFVTQATHELRNPLTSIRLHVEEAIDLGDEDPAARANALQVIQQESRRLERVVADMLSASEIEAGALTLRRSEVQLKQMVDDLQADFTAQANAKDIELVFDLPPKYPRAFADRDKLVLAIHNVIGNAVKYTEAGGRVTARFDADDYELRVEVTDTGIGISTEDQARVFDRFFRAADERVGREVGSGLGLALTKEIVELHGGEIELLSEVGAGSTFRISVPITPDGSVRQAA